jgi:uridine monophosphate synthetase
LKPFLQKIFEKLKKRASTMATTASTLPFFLELDQKCREKNSLLCVGLDPHKSELSAFANFENSSLKDQASICEDFCMKLIDSTYEHTACYKPNIAFFEVFGEFGYAVLKKIISKIHALNCLCVLDCKRGDISTTAEAYAEASYEYFQSDVVTLHPYMGWDSIEPFVTGKSKNKGCFVLVKTSNKSSNELQTLSLSGSSSSSPLLYEKVAKSCEDWSLTKKCENQIGMVVGATDSEALRRCRAQAPSLWILAPGVGFQGGDLSEAVKNGIRLTDGLGLLVPVSRAISRAKDPKQAAKDLKEQLNSTRDEVLRNAANNKRTKFGAENDETCIQDYQTKFFSLAIRCGVLKFGSFTLKSGRISPYFFNAGLFNTGSAMFELASCYAKSLQESGLEFDVLFGPAYKGIPLASCVSSQLFSEFKRDVPFCYNRKEEKDHGRVDC